MKNYGLCILLCFLSVQLSLANNKDLQLEVVLNAPMSIQEKTEKLDSLILKYLHRDHQQALLAAQAMDSLAIAGRLDTQEARANHFLGICYNELEMYPEAIEHNLKALKIYQALSMHRHIAGIYANLGAVYHIRRDLAETMEHYEKAICYYEEAADQKRVAIISVNIGNAYSSAGNSPMAQFYYQKAAQIFLQEEPGSELKALYNNLGTESYYSGNKEKAVKYLQKSIELPDSLDTRTHIMALGNCAAILTSLGRMEEAKTLFEEVKSHPIFSQYHEQQMVIAKAESYWYEKQGRYEEALAYHKLYVRQKDSTFSARQDTLLSQLKIKQALIVDTKLALAVEKKEQQALIFQQEKEAMKRQEQNLFIGLGLSFLIILFLALLLAAFRKIIRQEKSLKVKQAKEWAQEKRLLATQAIFEGQLQERKRIAQDLHDSMGGLLLGLRSHIQQIEERTSPSLTPLFQQTDSLFEKTTEAIRRISHDLMPQILEKGGLSSALKSLAGKYSKKLSCELEIFGDLGHLPENIALNSYFIFQELCQNAMKHAQASSLFLQCLHQEEHLYLLVEDDGKGFVQSKALAKRGLGLSNIKNRIEALGGKLMIDSRPSLGSSFQIELPIT